ncbi:MAG: BatD family protein [Candidatus Azobacteroides sp.]|nr:BatD family protein [Candidatus Azobacteroides sp.]
MKILTVILSFLTMFSGYGYSQKDSDGVSMNVLVEKNIEAGKQFRILFEINSEKAENFKAPGFKGFKVIYGPSQTSSSSTTIINGKVNTEFKINYIYVLEAVKKGDFTISEASVSVDDKIIRSKPVSVKVVSGNKLNKIKEKEEKERKESVPIKLEVFAPDSVAIYQRFRVIFEVNAREDEMKLKDPVFNNFLILAGPDISVSDVIEPIDGQRVLMPETSYVYVLEAEKKGIFTIPATEIIINGKKYKSRPVKIKVVEKIDDRSPQQQKREEDEKSIFL